MSSELMILVQQSMIVDHHKLENLVKMLDFCVQVQGQAHSRGSKLYLFCVSPAFSVLLSSV